MIDNNESTSGGRYPKSTEYKGRKIKFSDLSSSELQSSELQSSELQSKAELKVEKRSGKIHKPSQDKAELAVEKRSDKSLKPSQNNAALEVEKRSGKSQDHLQILKVEIDDEAFEVVEIQEGVFESGLLPYSSYSSPVELAQDVIDYISEFKK